MTNRQTPLFSLTVEQAEPLIKGWVTEALTEQLPTKEKQDLFYTREEVCQLLNVAQSTLTKYLKEGKLSGRRVGHRILFFKDDILNALKEYDR